MLLDLSRNTLVELLLVNAASVGEPGGVEDVNLEKELCSTHDVQHRWHLPPCRLCS